MLAARLIGGEGPGEGRGGELQRLHAMASLLSTLERLDGGKRKKKTGRAGGLLGQGVAQFGLELPPHIFFSGF